MLEAVQQAPSRERYWRRIHTSEAVVVADLPHVIEKAKTKMIKEQGGDPKVSFVECDLLREDRNDLPAAEPAHDLDLMVVVLHGLDDANAVKAL